MKTLHAWVPVRRLRALTIAVGILTAIALGEGGFILLIAKGWRMPSNALRTPYEEAHK